MAEVGRRKSGGMKWVVLVLLALAALTAGRLLTAPDRPGGSGGQAGKAGQAGKGGPGGAGGGGRVLEVAVMVLQPETVSHKLQSTGTVMAREEVELKSETSGRVTAVRIREGAPVRKGALLVKINDAELKAQMRKLGHQIKLSEEREFRQRALLGKQAVSQEEYDVALQERNALLAERDLLRAQAEKTEVRAPFDGVVGLKAVGEGSYVSPGTRIAAFFSLHPLKIDFSIPEQYFSRVKAGDSVTVRVEGVPDPVRGSVYAVEPKVDPATRMLRIRAYCPNEEGRIPPGASARVELPLEAAQGVVMAPSTAVVPDIRGQKVFLMKGGKAKAVAVASGYRTEDRVELTGVSPGDTLITTGLVQLKDGMAVKVAAAGGRGGRPERSAPADGRRVEGAGP